MRFYLAAAATLLLLIAVYRVLVPLMVDLHDDTTTALAILIAVGTPVVVVLGWRGLFRAHKEPKT